MSNGTIGLVEPGNPTKRLDTTELTVGANTVERERVQLAGAAASELADVRNAAPASSDYGVVVRVLSADLGATTDAEATGDGTLIAIAKRLRTLLGSIVTLLGGGLPAALGASGGLKIDGSGTALPVSGTVIVTGATATALGKAEDAAHSSGDTGVMVLAVRQNTAAQLADTNADYSPLINDASGRLWVNTELPDAGSVPSNNSEAISSLSLPIVRALLTAKDGNGLINTSTLETTLLSLDALTASSYTGLQTRALQIAFDGSKLLLLRTPNVFKTVSLTAATAETTIWTPTAGKKFRLMGFILTCGAASTLTFKDNTAGTTIFAARGTTDQPFSPAGMGNGILSAAANNVLTVTRSASVTLDGVVWGTEE